MSKLRTNEDVHFCGMDIDYLIAWSTGLSNLVLFRFKLFQEFLHGYGSCEQDENKFQWMPKKTLRNCEIKNNVSNEHTKTKDPKLQILVLLSLDMKLD